MDDRTLPTEGGIGNEPTVQAGDDAPASGRASVRSIPKQLGRFEVLGVIGRGGMGAVYAAFDPELDRKVAIKVRHPELGDAARAGVRREAQALARLVHPNVVAVYDVHAPRGDGDGGEGYVVMQLVDGASIERWAQASKASPERIVAAFRSAGRGLVAAHAAGLVHRDVKPGNILVDRDGTVRVGDFGIASAIADRGGDDAARSRAEISAGTPAYMAPEQRTGRASAASDQYALAVSLWEVLDNQRPGKPPRARPRRMPAYVYRALTRALADDPAARYPSMAAFVEALRPPRRGYLVVAAIAACAVAAVAVVAHDRAPPREPVAAVEPSSGPAPSARAAVALTPAGSDACAAAPTLAGGTVVYDLTARDAVNLYAIPLGGGTPHQLTFATTWEWRPNTGRRAGEVVHLVTDPASDDAPVIAALDVSSGSDVVIARSFANDTLDAIAIGDDVYYARPSELHRVRGGSDDVIAFASTTCRLRYLAASRDGAWLASVGESRDGGWGLCWFDREGGAGRCGGSGVAEGRPAFSADGREVYVAGVDGVRRVELATGVTRVAVRGLEATGGLAIADGGTALVASTCRARTQLVDVAQAPAVARSGDDDADEPSFARDGTLAYLVARGTAQVAVVEDTAGQRHDLTAPPLAPHALAISPDGAHVAIAIDAPEPGLQIRSTRERNDVVQVATGATDRPRWIDDGHLAFTRNGSGDEHDVYTVGLDGAQPRRVLGFRSLLGAKPGALLVASFKRVTWLDVATGAERAAPVPGEETDGALSASGRYLAWEIGNTGGRSGGWI